MENAQKASFAHRSLRILTRVEGISLLFLILVAMPLKYAMHMPTPVRVVGMLHGVTFIAYCWTLMQLLFAHECSFKDAVALFVSSFIPGGFIWAERRINQWPTT